MPLTVRTNGSGASNIIGAAWFNDFYNLLTGAMSDQQVQLKCNLTLKGIGVAPGSGMSGVAVSGSGMGTGPFTYCCTFGTADGGETTKSPSITVTTTTGNNNVQLSNIPTGPSGTTKRNIYRTSVNGVTLRYIGVLNDNTTTSWLDNNPDGSLGGGLPSVSTFGGALYIQDSTGAVQARITTDGQVMCGGLYLNTVTPYIMSSAGYVGFKNATGVKLAEVMGNGNFLISGSQLASSGGSNPSLNHGVSFDGFDVAEIYECDQAYAAGTVVCPNFDGKMTKCAHDNCHAAQVISHSPGLLLGAEDHEAGYQAVAMAGRVNVLTAMDLSPRTIVCSDGRGGVRAIGHGEPSFALGVTLNSTAQIDGHPQVGMLLRPLFCIIK